MSHHLDSPASRRDPRLNVTDVYAFDSSDAPEVMYGLVTNSAVPTGLVAASASETRQDKFPYVVPA